jgi:IS5 family transposase
MGVEKMLRMYLLQCWFNLSDEGIEDAIYDSYALRSFMKLNFVDEQVPDATTLLKFRHLPEERGIAGRFFHSFNTTLEKCGYLMRGGSIIDATLIHAPSSTKNAKKQRDPEMCRTKKGNQWDLTRIPLLLADLLDNCDFYLRQHMARSETVFYAIPRHH